MFWCIYRFFDILVILTGKIIFFHKKNILEMTRMAIILPKSTKYPKTAKCPKKTLLKPHNLPK